MIETRRERRREAARFLESRLGVAPRTLLQLGTGQGGFADRLSEAIEIPYRDIPHFKSSTAPSHAGRLVAGRLNGQPVLVMKGRLHLYEGHSWEDVTFPIRVAFELGVRRLVACNGGGSVNPYYRPGDVMVIRDHINLLWGNPLVGPNDPELGPEFLDMTDAYTPRLRRIAHSVAGRLGIQLHEGVYVANLGRTFETPAETFMAYRLGGDIVGMSTVPEVIVARHAGMEVLGFSIVGNLAAGLSREPLPTGLVSVGIPEFERLLGAVLDEVLALPVERGVAAT
ncbi:MAG TPA: purine-nucleoside phosphorylase [Candidatus Limnocylindria bacterium]|nr:purine-nucleoside phosphorylase [Candidatus Limnocylindria bacterium]